MASRRPLRLLLLVASLATAGACDQVKATFARASRIEVDSGSFVDGDEQVTWHRAPGSTAQVVFEETARFGDDGVAVRRYVFTDDLHFIRYTERRTQTVQREGSTPGPQQVDTELEFDGAEVLRQARQVDGEVVPLSQFDIDFTQRRAAMLLERWHPTPPP